MSNTFFRLSNTYFWYFSVLGLLVPFLAVFLDGRGFNSVEIGEMFAIITATRIFGPTIWAMFADRTGKQLPVIKWGAFLAFVSFSLLFFTSSYWTLTLSLALFSLFWTAILPQVEVMTSASIRQSPKIYARIRLWGSIGFIVLAMLSGELISNISIEAFIAIGSAILLLLWASTFLHNQPKVKPRQTQTSGSIWSRILDRQFFYFFIAGLLLQVSFGPFYTFFGLYISAMEYPSYAIGAFISVGVVAEIGIFIIAGRLFQAFGIKALLVCSIFLTAIRWYITGMYADHVFALVFAQFIHAASFGLYHSASMQFIQRHFARNQQNRGQAIYIGGVYGIGGALGAYLAGIYWLDGQGATHTFILAAVTALVGSLIALLLSSEKMSSEKVKVTTGKTSTAN